MKRLLLLLIMLMTALVLSGCISSIATPDAMYGTEGTLHVTFYVVNSVPSSAKTVHLSGSMTIRAAGDNSIVCTIPAEDMTVYKTTHNVVGDIATSSSVTIEFPYSGLTKGLSYFVDSEGLTITAKDESETAVFTSAPTQRSSTFVCGQPLSSPSTSPDTQPTPLPVIPVVPVTGDSASPMLWLAAALLTMAGALLLMRRKHA